MSETGYGDFEFERRFWVRDVPAGLLDDAPALIVQSYLLSDEGYALRVRAQVPEVAGGVDLALDELTLLDRYAADVDFCAVTVKGPMVEGTRYEAEREIDVTVGVELVRRGGLRVAKTRHAVWLGGDGWVVDTFAGSNAPLMVAEVERSGPVTDLVIPEFCVTELTDDPRFTNDALALDPYGTWAADYERALAASGPHFLRTLGRNRREDGAEIR